jgi:hypothetical protein
MTSGAVCGRGGKGAAGRAEVGRGTSYDDMWKLCQRLGEETMCVIYAIRRVCLQLNISVRIRQRKTFGARIAVAGYV